jgi:hypothetical protein
MAVIQDIEYFKEMLDRELGFDVRMEKQRGTQYEITLFGAAQEIANGYMAFEYELDYLADDANVEIVAHDYDGSDYYIVIR